MLDSEPADYLRQHSTPYHAAAPGEKAANGMSAHVAHLYNDNPYIP